MVSHQEANLAEQNEIKYLELAEKILVVLKAYGGHMTAREVAAELFVDRKIVELALTDLDLGMPIARVPINGTMMYKFVKPV